MNMNKIFKSVTALSALFVILFVASCEETDYMRFDPTHNGIYFTKDTLEYSFSVTPSEIRSYEYKIPVRVMGGISDEARTINYRIIEDKSIENEKTKVAEAEKHYRIKEACILPDSIDGHILVEILRDNLEGTYTTGYTTYQLCVELLPNENFTPTLDSTRHVRTLRFDNSVSQPGWYKEGGTEKVWSTSYYGEWHPYKYIKLVEYFNEYEAVNSEMYKKIRAQYGEYLENIPYGDPYEYRTIFVKYLYAPMYEYFSNEENRDYILSLYPDFPFDFPDPYASKE